MCEIFWKFLDQSLEKRVYHGVRLFWYTNCFVNPSQALDLYSNYCPGQRRCKYIIPWNAFIIMQAPRTEKCEKLEVCTVHRGRHQSVNKMLYKPRKIYHYISHNKTFHCFVDDTGRNRIISFWHTRNCINI
jgi:hypothetical protein